MNHYVKKEGLYHGGWDQKYDIRWVRNRRKAQPFKGTDVAAKVAWWFEGEVE